MTATTLRRVCPPSIGQADPGGYRASSSPAAARWGRSFRRRPIRSCSENALAGQPGVDGTFRAQAIPRFRDSRPTSASTRATRCPFKVNTTSTNYAIDIYRLGYYGGAGARKVTTVLPSAALPQTQPACLIESADRAWSTAATGPSRRPGPSAAAVSGIYVAKLTRIDTGGASHIVFIVRDDARQADVLVQTSDTTWQAYNRYGGGSLYCARHRHQQCRHGLRGCTGRRDQGQLQPPVRHARPRCHAASCSTPNTRWCAGSRPTATTSNTRPASTPIARGADLIGARRSRKRSSRSATTSTGRAGSARASKRRATPASTSRSSAATRSTGRRGSSRASTATDTPYRTLVSYKDTLARRQARSDAGRATGTWRDTRFGPPVADGGRPENALDRPDLDGQLRHVGDHRARRRWRNLRFWQQHARGDPDAGVATLAPTSLGYEWGEDLDNGVAPGRLDSPVVDDGQRRREDRSTSARRWASARPRTT